MAKISGKVACVTGALSGIGYEFAKYLTKHDVAALFLTDVDVKRAPEVLTRLNELGPVPVKFLKVNLTSMFEIECVLEKVVKEFHQLDILINNVGILSETNYEQMIKINYINILYGTMLALYRYLPKYKMGSEGVIVNTASVFGLQPGHSTPVYNACSNAIIGIGRSFGSNFYYNRYKTKVLTLCPGLTASQLTAGVNLEVDEKHYEHDRKQYPQQTPVWCGRCLIKMIEEAENGSVWIPEGEKYYEWPKDAYRFKKEEDQSS